MSVFLGYRWDGRAIWSYSGGSEGAPEDDGAGDGGGTDDDRQDSDGLGDAGRRALDTMRGDLRAAQNDLRPWRVLAKELGVKSPDEVRSRLAAMTKEQGEAARERDRRDAEILTKANQRILRAEIKALAADGFADPGDAVLNLDPSDYEVDDDGNVPTDRIKRDLADLLKRKPHLARVSKKVDFEPGARRPAPSAVSMDERIRAAARRT